MTNRLSMVLFSGLTVAIAAWPFLPSSALDELAAFTLNESEMDFSVAQCTTYARPYIPDGINYCFVSTRTCGYKNPANETLCCKGGIGKTGCTKKSGYKENPRGAKFNNPNKLENGTDCDTTATYTVTTCKTKCPTDCGDGDSETKNCPGTSGRQVSAPAC